MPEKAQKENKVTSLEKGPELLGLLNQALARELQVSIQYMLQKAMGTSLRAGGRAKTADDRRVKFVASRVPYWLPGKSLKRIAIGEMIHAEHIGERIVHLDGEPTTQPAPITLGETVREMLELDREQEAGAIRLYRQIIAAAETDGDEETKRLFQRILEDEEKHHRIFAEMLQG
jgi:bacterioferritin